jgi:hypothetical protein
MRRLLALSALAIVLAAPAGAQPRTWVGFQVGIQAGSPPPIEWSGPPHVVVVRDVEVVDDDRCPDDVFVYHRAWWRMSNGWWYRGSSWRGPWRAVDVRVVPASVLYVPSNRWKHHPHGGPPGQMKKRGGWDDDDEGNGRGHGKGRGHDRGRW